MLEVCFRNKTMSKKRREYDLKSLENYKGYKNIKNWEFLKLNNVFELFTLLFKRFIRSNFFIQIFLPLFQKFHWPFEGGRKIWMSKHLKDFGMFFCHQLYLKVVVYFELNEFERHCDQGLTPIQTKILWFDFD